MRRQQEDPWAKYQESSDPWAKYKEPPSLARELPQMGPKPAIEQTPGEVAWSQTKDVLRGIPEAITGIPAAAKAVGQLGWDLAMGRASAALTAGGPMVKAAAQPLTTSARGAGALLFPEAVTAPTEEAWSSAARGAGANLGGLVLGKAGGTIVKEVPRLGAALRQSAAVSKERALAPVTLETKAVTQQIAPELVERGQAQGWRGGKIDKNIKAELDRAGQAVGREQTRVLGQQPNTTFAKADILQDIDQLQGELKVPGTNVIVQPAAAKALDDLAAIVDQLPDQIRLNQAFNLREQLDNIVKEMGGYKETATQAERLMVEKTRQVADLVRKRINQLDTGLAKANADYSLAIDAANVVKRRGLGEVGKPGTFAEAMAAAGGGSLLGLPFGAAGPGAVVGGTLALGRRALTSRGGANIAAGIKSGLAPIFERHLPLPPPIVPRTAGAVIGPLAGRRKRSFAEDFEGR